MAKLTCAHFQTALQAASLSVDELVDLFAQLDIYRREQRFRYFIIVVDIIAKTKKIPFHPTWLLHAATLAKSIDVQALIKKGYTGYVLALELKKSRLAKLKEWLKKP